ncbi:MAG: hypothetical protein ACE5FP_03125, partial [Gemmatimonadota bacterium]
SFYEARAVQLASGTYVVRGAHREFGSIVAVDSGGFSPMRASGEGTVQAGGGCALFGPGRLGNQRPFALMGRLDDLAPALDSDRVVWVQGSLSGFTLCGSFGSRPAIRVEAAEIRDGSSGEYYSDHED